MFLQINSKEDPVFVAVVSNAAIVVSAADIFELRVVTRKDRK